MFQKVESFYAQITEMIVASFLITILSCLIISQEILANVFLSNFWIVIF